MLKEKKEITDKSLKSTKLISAVEIEKWLTRYGVKNYELIPDEEYCYVVNVNGNVDLSNKKLTSIDVKFNEINGYFDCSSNKIINLDFLPKYIKEDLYICHNKIKTLIQLKNIKFDGNFNCAFNNLESLEGCPEIISGYLNCRDNELTLNGISFLPKEIYSNKIYISNNNKLDDFQYITDFNKIKKVMKIIKEKTDLTKAVEKADLIKVVEKNNLLNIKKEIRKI